MIKLVLSLLFLPMALIAGLLCDRANADSLRVGDGKASLVFYSQQGEVLRELHGLNGVTGCFAAPDGSIIFSASGRNELLRIDQQGNISSLFALQGQPSVVKRNQNGEYLVVMGSKVLMLNPDGSTKYSVSAEFISDVDFHPAGGFLAVINTWNGSLVHYDWNGKAIWRSTKVRESQQFLGPLYGITSKDTNTHLVSDGSYTYEVSRDYQTTKKHNLRAIPGGSVPRYRADGGVFLFSPSEMSAGVLAPDGTISGFSSNLDVSCGDTLPDGRFFLTFYPRPAGEWKGRSFYSDYSSIKPQLTLSSVGGVIILTILCSLAVVSLTRRYMSGIIWPAWRDDSTASKAHIQPSSSFSSRKGFLTSSPLTILILTSFATGCWLFNQGILRLKALEFGPSSLWFIGGAFSVAASITLLNYLLALPRDFTRFGLTSLYSRFENRLWWPLLTIGAIAGGACSYLHQTTGDTKLAVALWFAAPIFFIGAFRSKQIADSDEDRLISRQLLPLLLCLSALINFWQIGFYPDLLHHDHGIIGQSALKILLGDWNPFFILDPNTNTMMRPWLLPMSATLYLLGYDYWVLRVTAAVWGIALVYATYLFASAIGSKRLGIIAATFAATHHILLVYIRQPYVTESTAPFMFCMYFLVAALKTGSLWSWAWCGAWAGLSMLSIRQCTTFPFIWGALFVCCSLLFFKSIWRNKTGLLVLLISGLIITGPFILTFVSAPSGGALVDRLSQTSILFGTNLKPNPDLKVWAYQFGRSFGGFLFYTDESHWGISTPSPIFLAFSACLFMTGIAYLILKPFRTAAPFILITIAVSVTLGSAMIMSPPSYYHFFVGIVMALVAAAIPLERLWSCATVISYRPISYAIKALVIAAVAFFAAESFSPFWRITNRPASSKDPALAAWGPNIYSVMGRWVGDHQNTRFYIVRQPRGGFSSTDGIFHFLGFYSDLSDIMYDLDSDIPVKPDDSYNEFQVVVLPQRAQVIPSLKSVYPNGKWSRLGYGVLQQLEFIDVLTLSKQDVKEAFDAKRVPPQVPGVSSFVLRKTV